VQTRTRNALVFAAGMAVVVAAVVAVGKLRQTPAPPPSALDAIPDGALLIATASVEPLRRSGAFAPVFSEAREIPGLGKVKDVCGFDPLENLKDLAIAVPAAGNDGDFGLVAAGKIDQAALVACAAKVIEARGGRSVVNTIGGFSTVRDASQSTSGAEIAVREGGPVLLGAGSYLRSMIDAADGRVPSVRADAAHERLRREAGEGALRVTVVLTAEQRRTLSEELSRGGALGSPVASIVGLGLAVSLEPRIALHGVVACDAAKPCAELAKIFDARRAAQAEDTLARLLGAAPLLERLRIVAEGERIHGRVDMSADEATNLIERLLVLRNAARQREAEPPSPRPNDRPIPLPEASATVRPDAGEAPKDAGAEKSRPR